MELTFEEDGDALQIHSPDKNHTVMTLLKQAAWAQDSQAGYDRGHPYTGDATLVINADNPHDVLDDAIDHARNQISELRDAFEDA